jgi:hypothetical protein
MSLREQQRLLADLYTNPKRRENYFQELSSSGFKKEEVIVFAQGLLSKRLNVVKGMFPLTFAYDENLFRSNFMEYASSNSMQGFHLKHHKDALAFYKYLLNKKKLNEYLVEVIKYEVFQLKSFLPEKHLIVLLSNHRFYKATPGTIKDKARFHGRSLYMMIRLNVKNKWFTIFKEI